MGQNKLPDNQLKLPSGKIITFNNQQFDGINKIKKWLRTGDTFFTLSGYAGTGKSQTIDSQVFTPDGVKKIGELKIDDYVFGVNGKPIRVTGIFPQGIKQAYRITFRDNSYTEISGDHVWAVWTRKLRQKKKPTINLTTKELIENGLEYKYSNNKRNFKYCIPLCQPVQYLKKELPIHPYILGAFIGDGTNLGKTLIISIPDIDKELIEYILTIKPSYIKINEDRSSNCPRYNFSDIDKYHENKLADKFRKLNLNVKSGERFIPNIYKYSSVEQRWELLKGLMDTDGTSRQNKISYCTTSKQLCDDVIELVQSLGGTAIKQKERVISSGSIEYNINVKVFENPFRLSRKAKNWKFSKKNPPSRYIISIEKSRVVEQVCISVDAEDGLYLTDNYIVTHNTTIVKKILDTYRGGVVVSAPTHKAKKVVMNTTKQYGATLHSLLGLRPDVNLDDFNPNNPKFNPIAPPQITDFNLVIIDEASMINEDLFKLIKEKTDGRRRVRVLFMGDSAQIPPIGEKESVVFKQSDIEIHQLTKVERQADGNPLAPVYDALRNNLNEIDGGIKRITNINSKGEGILFTVNKLEFRKLVLDKFGSSDFEKDSDYVKMIAWKNDTVKKANEVIRGELFGKDSKFIEIGDILMGYRTISTKDLRYNIIENSADYRIVDMSDLEENKMGIKGYNVKLREDIAQGEFNFDNVFIIDVTDRNNLMLYGEMHDFFKYEAKKNKKNWPNYYEFRRHNLLMCDIEIYRNGLFRSDYDVIKKDLDYGLAITCHKSQGSTYTHVSVMENDINNNWVVKERNQIKYVSFTRPTTSATVLTTRIDY